MADERAGLCAQLESWEETRGERYFYPSTPFVHFCIPELRTVPGTW